MKGTSALLSGLTGAVALTLIHEGLRRIDPKAPRMDLLGMNALSKLLTSYGKNPPNRDKLFLYTMAGDIVSNALYYSLAGVGRKHSLLKGALLGAAAGVGGVLLPKPMGLNPAYSSRTTHTKASTIALYLIGGLVTAAAIKLLKNK
jgi:hypothetical protein